MKTNILFKLCNIYIKYTTYIPNISILYAHIILNSDGIISYKLYMKYTI